MTYSVETLNISIGDTGVTQANNILDGGTVVTLTDYTLSVESGTIINVVVDSLAAGPGLTFNGSPHEGTLSAVPAAGLSSWSLSAGFVPVTETYPLASETVAVTIDVIVAS